MIARTLPVVLIAGLLLALSGVGLAQSPGYDFVAEPGKRLKPRATALGRVLRFRSGRVEDLIAPTVDGERDLWSMGPNLRWTSRRLFAATASVDTVIQATTDSFPDLISLELGGGANDLIRVYVNQAGQGLVQAPVIPIAGSVGRPFSVIAGELTGDGLEDILLLSRVTQSGWHISVFPSLGNGQFGSLIPGPNLGFGPAPSRWLARLDGDADLDLLVARAGSLELFANDGTGQFTSMGDPTAAWRPSFRCLK